MEIQVATRFSELSDEGVAARVAEGDDEALAALYDRHVDALIDFACRILRDRDGADDVVQDSFVKAWETMRRRPGTVTNVRAWLFTVTRNAALDELRRRRPVAARDHGDEELAVADTSRAADPAEVALQHELAALVWEAAATLEPKDYALLDLHVRQGMSADELAASLGLRKGAVYTRLSRLRDRLEEAVGAALLSRHGRRDCAALDARLSSLPESASPVALRRAIRGHTRHCEQCQAARRVLTSPFTLLGSLVPVRLTQEQREALWQPISAVTSAVTADPERARRPGPGGQQKRRGRRPVAAVAGILVVIGLVAVGALASGPDRSVRLAFDPPDIRSTTHTPGVPSIVATVSMVWTASPGATAFSLLWSERPDGLPDTRGDLAGEATGTTSAELSPGSWWFHLRTRGRDGVWTSTAHVGPFLIQGTIAAPADPSLVSLPTVPPSDPLVPTPSDPAPTTTTVAAPPPVVPTPGSTVPQPGTTAVPPTTSTTGTTMTTTGPPPTQPVTTTTNPG